MTLIVDSRAGAEAEAQPEASNPFAETERPADEASPPTVGFLPWTENLDPFAHGLDEASEATSTERMLAAAFAELRDETFDEALANLAAETEQLVAERFSDEAAVNGTQRERLAESHLSGIRFEAEQYLDRLEQGVTGRDLESLSDEQLDEFLDSFDPSLSEVSPAGEEFIGGLIKKAKKLVKFVASNAVKTVGGLAGKLLGPILQRLRGLINPLLRRVLSFAIGRLPVPLQAAARVLATRITSETTESEESEEGEAGFSIPTLLSDVEALAESFDAAVAELMLAEGDRPLEAEFLSERDGEGAVEGRQLEALAEARAELIEKLRSADDNENLGPVVEQFIPALLGALRLGINLVGRPKVVGFLANYLSQLIGRWVGPSLSRPLSTAIVDTGLKLVSLEHTAMEAERGDEAAPVLLASVIEDTVRRLSENEAYVFENEELMQLATAEAFGQAVATSFPARLVRPGLQQAPSIGGAFVARRPRSIRTYRKYSRVPEVELTEQVANALPSFGGLSVGAVLRAAGARFPLRVRVHIYESVVGTTLPSLARVDTAIGGPGRSYRRATLLHPLTPHAAALLLREPQLGVHVPDAFLRSRHRVAVGQRFYYIEAIGGGSALALPQSIGGRPASSGAASQAWAVIDLVRSQIIVALYLSEVDSQRITEAIRQGRGGPALLGALKDTYATLDRSFSTGHGRVKIVRELEEQESVLGRLIRRLPPHLVDMLRQRLRGWLLPMVAQWVRTGSEPFVRAAAQPADGVTVVVTLRSVPGLDLVRQVLSGRIGAGARLIRGAEGSRIAPTVTVTVLPGKHRP
jgi:hypothetical protein